MPRATCSASDASCCHVITPGCPRPPSLSPSGDKDRCAFSPSGDMDRCAFSPSGDMETCVVPSSREGLGGAGVVEVSVMGEGEGWAACGRCLRRK